MKRTAFSLMTVLLAVMNAMWGEMAEDRRASHRRDDAA